MGAFPIQPPAFWVYKHFPPDLRSDEWVGIHLSLRYPTPWEWRGAEFGWVHINAMISPWWGETKVVSSEQAREFLVSNVENAEAQVDVFRVSENHTGELADAGLTDEVIEGFGFSRTGLVVPSESPVEGSEIPKIEITPPPIDFDTSGEVIYQPPIGSGKTKPTEAPGQSKLAPESIEFVRPAEDDLGISIDQCTAIFDAAENDLAVLGEISLSEKTDRDFEIVALIYDELGDLIAEESAVFLGANLGVFDSFKIEAFGLISTPGKIRVFPRAFN